MLWREEFFFLKLVPCGPINIYVLEREGGADNFLGGIHDFQGKREGDESVQTEYNGKTTEN